jgi:hypothetical protein
MMRKDQSQGFNLTGLFRAGQSDHVVAERDGRAVSVDPFQPVTEDMGNGALGLFASSLIARLGTQFEEARRNDRTLFPWRPIGRVAPHKGRILLAALRASPC